MLQIFTGSSPTSAKYFQQQNTRFNNVVLKYFTLHEENRNKTRHKLLVFLMQQQRNFYLQEGSAFCSVSLLINRLLYQTVLHYLLKSFQQITHFSPRKLCNNMDTIQTGLLSENMIYAAKSGTF